MPESAQRVWVVFSGQTEIPYLKFLRRGFRHCFIVLKRGDHWISLDPLAHRTEIELHYLPEDFDLPAWLNERGHTVVETDLRRVALAPLPPALFTCVEAVKRIVGVTSWTIMTPWQLYKHLSA
jgi:hypothetical protein